MTLRLGQEPVDDEVVALLENISQITGTPINDLIRLAVLEFVQSFDLDFAGAKNDVIGELGRGN